MFREGKGEIERERERDRDRDMDVRKKQFFGVLDDAPSTWATWPGPDLCFRKRTGDTITDGLDRKTETDCD